MSGVQLISGAGGGGGGKSGSSGAGVEAPNTLRSVSTIRIIDVISEGPIGGLVNGEESFYIDETPLKDSGGNYSFEGVKVWGRNGLPDQPHVSGFPAVESEEAVGVLITKDSPEGTGSGDGSVVRQVSNPLVDAVRIKIRLQGLTFQKSSGELIGNFVDLAIDVQPFGDVYTEVVNTTIRGKCTSPYERAYRVALPEGGAPWNIRVRRLSSDPVSATNINRIFFGSYTELIDAKLTYPNTAYAAIAADAQAFGGQVPSRKFHVYGIICSVPSNYDPLTREYDGIWDGSFIQEWTDNPAWIVHEMLTNDRWGLGEFIDLSQVDAAKLYQIGQYCDELVDDAEGGQEPRWRFNGVIEGKVDAIKAITTFAATFRGAPYWSSGSISFAHDAPADPIKIITPANTVDGHFVYSGSALKTRPTVVRVTFNDPTNLDKPKIAVVELADKMARYGKRQVDMTAIGCRSKGQAIRTGRWALETNWSETDVCKWSASFDQIDFMPGDICQIHDPMFVATGDGYGGRLKAATLTTLTLDRQVDMNSGTWEVAVMLPDGSLEERALTNPPETTDTLNLASALSDTPVVGAMFGLTSNLIGPRLFRILGIEEKPADADKQETNIFAITATQHDPAKYARIEGGIVPETPPYTNIPTGPLLKPVNISHSEYLYQPAASVLSAATFSWEAPADPRVDRFEAEIKAPGGEWDYLGITSQLSLVVAPTEDGAYEFRVRSLWQNIRSPWATYSVTLNAMNQPPQNVQNFRIQIVGAVATLTWDGVPDLNLDHYRIKYSAATSGASWGASTDLLSQVDGRLANVPALPGTYLIKAVTVPAEGFTAGKESAAPAILVSTINGVEGLNAVVTSQQDATFSGTKSDCEVDTGALVISEETTDVLYASAIYEFDAPVDLGAVYTSRLSLDLEASGQNKSNVMANWPVLAELQSLSGADPSSWDLIVEMQTTDDDPGGSPTWSDWSRLTVSDHTARGFKFRATLIGTPPSITPRVSKLRVIVDMPDRLAAGKNIVVPVDGSTITYAPAFKFIAGLSIVAHNMQENDEWLITDDDEEGFTIEFFNGAASVSREFSYVATGHGYKG